MPQPLVIAHRGASAEYPENTLPAFRRAIAAGADGIELDVHVTADGVPVVFHDSSLARLTGARGRIAARTWPELAALRVQGLAPIPRLLDVLRCTRGRVVVQIELKAGVPVAPVVAVVRAARSTGDVILASFSPALLAEARRLAPRLPRMLITEGRALAPTLVRRLTALEAAGLSVNHRSIRNAGWPGAFQSHGFRVWCWTVNEPARMRVLAGWGVDAILSDNPALLRRVIRFRWISPTVRRRTR
ncbi:MAG TPA: glycerophosphodiester phosphodiesterase [Lacunisphaera sp.]|nr:glycerophosphodiester phosphodiesterase [Lacunisphaera sp.]